MYRTQEQIERFAEMGVEFTEGEPVKMASAPPQGPSPPTPPTPPTPPSPPEVPGGWYRRRVA